MRILHVGFSLGAQEPERLLEAWPTLTGVAAALARAGNDVTVLQLALRTGTLQRDHVTYQFVSEGHPGFRTLPGGRRFPRRPSRLLRLAASLAPDVAHIHGLGFPMQTRYLARALPRTPLVAQDHANRPPEGWRRVLHRWGLRALSGVLFTAREQAQPFIQTGTLRKTIPVFEALEGSTGFTPGNRMRARAATGLRGDPCLVWLGRLDENKDPLTVLEALSIAAPRLRDPHLWCCFRSAPLLETVRERIRARPALAGRVHLLGERRHGEIEPLLRAADFLVQGSRFEGSGYAVIEALACGTVPLVTDIPSLRRITQGGTVGALSPPGDAGAMSRALCQWSRGDRELQRRRAREHFVESLSFEAIAVELEAAYRRVSRPSALPS
ncbi:MAG: glycosyltransferase family 4 protein [Acidobacteriota bacterium]